MPCTKVVDVDDYPGAEEHWSCNDCGAHANKPENIEHHKTCVPGESKKLEDFYSQPENQDSADTVGSPGDDL